ncbi:hypothetical protein HNV12_28780 [Methanococcoides sp. SA1]|nr:hypothetical protein [Methanococcoides sp. SA1]
MMNVNGSTGHHIFKLSSASTKEEFHMWRKEWLVENAKTRQLDDHKYAADNKITNGFWSWYLEKHKDLTRRYNHLYSDITARDCRELEMDKSKSTNLSISSGYVDLDHIRQEFIKHDRGTIEGMATSLKKIGLANEAEELLSLKPIDKNTMVVLDRFFDALHNKDFNDMQIIDFYLDLSPEERVSLGCKP